MGSSNTGVKDDSTTDADTSTGDLPASNSGTFSEGEKVLAYHGPRIYEAKVSFFCLFSRLFDFFFLYFIVFYRSVAPFFAACSLTN